MGSTPQKTNNKAADLDDEDDFFGGGFGTSKNDKINKQKEKNSENSDPLAFLQRAKAEKESAANKKARQMQKSKEEWKTKEQLDYNLNSEFMDFDDKWKQNLGSDLYKERANMLAVDSQTR